MTKWEYLDVTAYSSDGKTARPGKVNGNELGDWKRGPLIHDYLNQLGEQGWELVGMTSTSGYGYIFKRPKS